MIFGKDIDSELNNVFAYKLDFDQNLNKEKDSLKLFKPYFNQYQSWRDESIEKIKEINNENINVIAFSLDIKNYYYSVDIDFDNLKNDLFDKFIDTASITIFDIIKRIIINYSLILKKTRPDCSNNCLPIGFLPSGILANWYLEEFDKKILEELYPSYYGRYVDDILIVLKNYDKKKKKPEEYLNKYFIKKNAILADKKDGMTEYQIIGYPLFIQENKLKIFDIYANGSKALINNFVTSIRENSSEFRLLPEDNEVIKEFDEEAYTTIYSDSINKIRSLEDFKGNKYGVSKYLAKIMFSSKYWGDDLDNEKIVEITNQITSFFKGKLSLQFMSVWEKIFTYYVIRRQKNYIIKLFETLVNEIKKVNFDPIDNDNTKIYSKTTIENISKSMKEHIIDHLSLSLIMALSLNPQLIIIDDEKNELNKIIEAYNLKPLKKELLLAIRKSNLIRHNYINIPLLNYTELINEDLNLLNYCDNYKNNSKYLIDKNLFKYSPRFVHFNECLIYYINYMMLENDINKKKLKSFENEYLQENKYTEDAINLFLEINNKDKKNNDYNFLKGEKLDTIITNNDNSYSYIIKKYRVKSKKEKILSPKIGVVSIKVDSNDIEGRFISKRNLSREREQRLYKLLNLAIEEKSNGKKIDILVLPELSIPYEWMQIISDVARKNNILIIAGFEHWIKDNKNVFNYLALFIPFEYKGYRSCLIKIRNKNCFSHDEIKLIKKYGFNYHKNKNVYYDLINWNNINFSCYNCFELADITHRSIFKSKVDILFASEYNKDINYFSNIIESIVRDIHCYFVQVNTSDYGDSRIVKPAKTEEKNILQLKGGDNITILTATLDLQSLRKHQMKYEFDKADEYKPTPPNFNQEESRKRWNEANND